MIRVGIGGWVFEPWRGTFYPPGLKQKDELGHAARVLSAIEINGTFYRLQAPRTFAGWRDAVPDGFVFALKGSRFCTNRRNLAEAGESVAKFCAQGLVELGDRLGPINWQLAASKRFDPDEIAAFLALLPRVQDGVPLRHAIEVRHASFACPAFVALARAAGVAIVCADSDEHPQIADPSGDLVYARLMRASADEPAGYAPAVLDGWADVARQWAAGGAPAGLAYADAPPPPGPVRDVFVFMINGAKVRAPAAAQALIARLGGDAA